MSTSHFLQLTQNSPLILPSPTTVLIYSTTSPSSFIVQLLKRIIHNPSLSPLSLSLTLLPHFSPFTNLLQYGCSPYHTLGSVLVKDTNDLTAFLLNLLCLHFLLPCSLSVPHNKLWFPWEEGHMRLPLVIFYPQQPELCLGQSRCSVNIH